MHNVEHPFTEQFFPNISLQINEIVLDILDFYGNNIKLFRNEIYNTDLMSHIHKKCSYNFLKNFIKWTSVTSSQLHMVV